MTDPQPQPQPVTADLPPADTIDTALDRLLWDSIDTGPLHDAIDAALEDFANLDYCGDEIGVGAVIEYAQHVAGRTGAWTAQDYAEAHALAVEAGDLAAAHLIHVAVWLPTLTLHTERATA